VTQVFEQLGVKYFIGGSLASSQHGIPRATLDTDIVTKFMPDHIRPLLDALGDAWYADEDAIRDAIRRKSSFNLIHMETAQKVDVFVSKDRPFEQGEFAAATRLALGDSVSSFAPYFASAEHSVLAKLEWFRLGGEISDRQWNDVLGILRVQAKKLNRPSMILEAATLGVSDLLQKAFTEADRSS